MQTQISKEKIHSKMKEHQQNSIGKILNISTYKFKVVINHLNQLFSWPDRKKLKTE